MQGSWWIRSSRAKVLLWLLACLASSCLANKAQAAGTYYPLGLTSATVLDGIAPGSDPGSCCWMGARAAFRLRAPHGADTIIVKVFIPPYAVGSARESFLVSIAGKAAQERCCYGPGSHELAFTIGKATGPRELRVSMRMSHTFVPRAIGIGSDSRHLSVLLRQVEFENITTGEIYEDGSPFSETSAGTSLMLALSLLGGLLALYLARRRPVFAAVALIVSAPFALYYHIHGTTITLPKAVLIGSALGLVLRWPIAYRLPGRTFWLLFGAQALLIASMIVSLVHAANIHAALRETLKDIEFLATFTIAYIAYRTDPDELLIRWALAATTVLVAVPALMQEFTGAPEGLMLLGHSIARIAGPLEGPNQLGAYLGIMVPTIAAFVALRPSMGFERIALALGALATVLTFSRGGIAGLLLAFAIILLLRHHRERARGIAIALAFGFVALFAIACGAMSGHLPDASLIFGQSTDAYNGGLGTRAELWGGADTLWREHSLFGVGPGNFELEISRFAPGVRTHANSEYFQVLAEQGVVGEVILLALVALSVGVFIRKCDDPLPLAGFTVATILAFHQIVDTLWIYPKVGIMWWVLIAIAASANDRTPDSLNAGASKSSPMQHDA
ncbi:MAG: O-antigen ligase family protein [Vulcanimicrobiaceae bacterium]